MNTIWKKLLAYSMIFVLVLTNCVCVQAARMQTTEGVQSASDNFVIEDGVLTAYKGKRAEHIVIPDGVTEIASAVFYEHTEIKSVTLPDSLIRLGDKAFAKCYRLTEIDLKNVETIGKRAFAYCLSMGGVAIPTSVKTIKDEAFYSCYNLRYAVFEDGITSIGQKVFDCCEQLHSVKVPASLQSVADYTFTECNLANDSVVKIYMPDEEFDYAAVDTTPTGDGNKDFAVDLSDARFTLECALGMVEDTEFLLAYCDVNVDGNIDLDDAQLVLKKALGIVEENKIAKLVAVKCHNIML